VTEARVGADVPRRRQFRGLALPVWAGGGVALSIGVAVVGTAAYLELTGQATRISGTVIAVGIAYAAWAGGMSALLASRFAAALRGLRDDAVRRLQDPTAPLRTAPVDEAATRASTELAELARTLDALHLRVRVADEVAERHRRTAETSSAGMFELLSGLVEAEEGTRGQLSAELHDTVAQTLMLARATLAGAPPTGELARALDLVAEAEEQVRAVMARTRPPALRDGDLAAAVAQLRADMSLRYGLDVKVRWPAEAYPLPLVTAVTVYRFFQEALLNVIKHADVDEAWATLDIDERGVTASVSDSGPGFDPTEVRADRGRHVGLGLLRERARLAGGSLDITSWPSIGTTLTLKLPRGAAVPSRLPVQSPGDDVVAPRVTALVPRAASYAD
jgi:two-component system sensor histidine kinase UhpB